MGGDGEGRSRICFLRNAYELGLQGIDRTDGRGVDRVEGGIFSAGIYIYIYIYIATCS